MAEPARILRPIDDGRSRRISSEQWRYLVLEQGVGAAILNFVLNAGIAWLLFRTKTTVPMWGAESIAGDTTVTAFVLAFLTCLIVTRMTRGRIRASKLAPLAWTLETHPSLAWRPVPIPRRALLLGVVCMITAAPLMIAALWTLGVDELSFSRFIVFKGAFAAGLAALVTPVVALWAITEAQPR